MNMDLVKIDWRKIDATNWKIREAKQEKNKRKRKHKTDRLYITKFRIDREYTFSWDEYLDYCFIEEINPILMYKKADGKKLTLKQYEDKTIVGSVKVNHNGFPVSWIIKPCWCRGIN